MSCSIMLDRLAMIEEHGVMTYNPGWLRQWKLSNCIIQSVIHYLIKDFMNPVIVFINEVRETC